MNKMKKYAFMFIAMFVIGQAGMFTAPILSASETTDYESTIVSEKQIDEFDQYVIQTEAGFGINEEAYNELSPNDLVLLEEQLNITNQSFDMSEFDETGDGYVGTVKDSELGKGIRSNGVSKINFYWWGFKAYMSRTLIRKSAGSVSVAGNAIAAYFGVAGWVGAAIVVGISLLGYSMRNVPHGVGMRYNYGVGVTKVWWQ